MELLEIFQHVFKFVWHWKNGGSRGKRKEGIVWHDPEMR